jgi:hypothetical protein
LGCPEGLHGAGVQGSVGRLRRKALALVLHVPLVGFEGGVEVLADLSSGDARELEVVEFDGLEEEGLGRVAQAAMAPQNVVLNAVGPWDDGHGCIGWLGD